MQHVTEMLHTLYRPWCGRRKTGARRNVLSIQFGCCMQSCTTSSSKTCHKPVQKKASAVLSQWKNFVTFILSIYLWPDFYQNVVFTWRFQLGFRVEVIIAGCTAENWYEGTRAMKKKTLSLAKADINLSWVGFTHKNSITVKLPY